MIMTYVCKTMAAVIAVLMLTGCYSVKLQTQPANEAVKAVLKGEDCVQIVLGLAFGTATYDRAMTRGVRLDGVQGATYTRRGLEQIRSVRTVALSDSYALLAGERCIEIEGDSK